MVRFIVLFAFIVMTGCATTGEGDKAVDDQAGQANKSDKDISTSSVSTSAMSDEERYSMKALNDPNSPLSIRTVYFAFDSSDITSESNDVLVEHARFLSLNPGVKVTLEGHADERGTRGYNLALGEGRAQAVAELFTAQGASMSQLEVVSYGEERPVAQEHDEAAWQLNRRVEILY
jgi:peptidoglycan-associated lipoprotein